MTPAHEDLALTLANKAILIGSPVAAAAGFSEHSGLVMFLGRYGTEIASVGVIAGVALGFAGFVLQAIFNYRRDKRENTESTWRMGIDPDRRKSHWRPGVDPDRRQQDQPDPHEREEDG